LAKQKAILRPFWRSCAIGLCISSLMMTAYRTGRMRQLEAWSLDLRFKYANRLLAESDRIRILAIDDQSLRQFGRWPWHRRALADLVRVLGEAGADRIVLDLHFPEPEPPRIKLADGLPELDRQGTLEILQQLPEAMETVRDDVEFAKAIGAAGNVYLPVVFDLVEGRYDLERARRIARRLVREGRRLTDEQFSQRVGLPKALLGPEAYLRSRIADLLRRRFWLEADQIATALDAHARSVQRWTASVRRQVAMELVQQHLRADPQASEEAVARAILREQFRPGSACRKQIEWAFRQVRSQQVVYERMLPLPAGEPQVLMQVRNPYRTQAPIELLGRAAAAFGHVVVRRDRDGVVRRLPMLVRWQNRVVPQLALRVAADVMGLDLQRMQVRAGTLSIPTREGKTLRLYLDETGQTVLNWVRPSARWEDCFDPLPVAYVLEVAQLRRQKQQNETLWQLALLKLVGLIQPTELQQYREIKQSLATARQQLEQIDRSKQASEARRLQEQITQHEQWIRHIETQCVALLKQEGPALRAALEQAADDAERSRIAEYLALYEDVAMGRLRRRLDQIKADLEQRIEERLAELRKRLAGKICFVGYTASALADLVSTPVWPNVPGVMTHAQLLNSLLQGRQIHPPERNFDAALVLLCCLVVTLATAWRGPTASLVTMLAANIGYAALNAFVLFERFGIVMTLATPTIGMFITWAMITAYRQLAEERAKRQLSRTLQQYTSPALARRMAEDPAAVQRAEVREVTCYFSDLKGFTGVSETLGAEATQQLLNLYLERMTEVLDEHEALINKFLGDGIFAFFNPAIHPQPDHAARACHAALASIDALDRLKRATDTPPGTELLHIRIGLAAGHAVVGNCGSERKFDYTCIGDTVNVASRLEVANKVLETRILINDRCRDLAGPRFAYRWIGRLQVAGRAAYVETYELLGLRDAMPDGVLAEAERFAQAVEDFIAGRFAEAKQRFETYLHAHPSDVVAKIYLDRCKEHLARPVPENWRGTIEILGK